MKNSLKIKFEDDFKPGDKVICIDGSFGASPGIYTVINVWQECLYLKETQGGWLKKRFQQVELPQSEEPDISEFPEPKESEYRLIRL